MKKSLSTKRNVRSKRAKTKIAESVESLPGIYFKIIGDQPVPVEWSLGAMTLDQAAKKTKWDREALEKLHQLFFGDRYTKRRWLDDMMAFHSTIIELRESIRHFGDNAPDDFQDEKRRGQIDAHLSEVMISILAWVSQITRTGVISGEIPAITKLIARCLE